MKTLEKSTGTVNVLAEYLDAGFSKKSYPAWIRHHFPDKEPHLASIKTTFFVSPREMIRAIQNSQKYKVNAEKREAWLNQAYADLKVQYKLNFDSILESKMLKKLFNLFLLVEMRYNNINGMNYSTLKRIDRDISASKAMLFEDILKEFGEISQLELPVWMSIKEIIRFFQTFNIEVDERSIYEQLRQLELCDNTWKGPGINNMGDVFINDVYLLLIRKLWK